MSSTRRISEFWRQLPEGLKVPMDRIPVNIDRYGNTSAASVPILLDELKRDGKLERGDKLVLAGFGSGMTWGATLLEW